MDLNMNKEEILNIIQDKIDDLEYENSQPRYSDEYYMKRDAKIEVLEEIIRIINN